MSASKQAAALSHFQRALRDPHYEQASYLILWKLGQKPLDKRALGPSSLRLYDAYLEGEFRPLFYFLTSHSGNLAYAPLLLEKIFLANKSVSFDDLRSLERAGDLSAEASLYLGALYDRKLKKPVDAARAYASFLEDPWSRRSIQEIRKHLFDQDLSKRVKFALAQKDGLTLKRLYRALMAKCRKLGEDQVPSIWKEAFEKAIAYDQSHITENLLSQAFWKSMELSPLAVQEMRARMFPEEDRLVPDFISRWNRFFASEKLNKTPVELEPDALALWQINVELDPECLSEALLKFPNEERFLLLWAERKKQTSDFDERRWPEDEKESTVVRENLERAFDRSTNKILWFDRLRSSGCSQDFYEYALDKVELPFAWVLEDLQKNFISNTPKIRSYLKDALSVITPGDAGSKDLKPEQLLSAFQFLTPSETQQVLLSRYVLVEIPVEILNEELLDLFWDARKKVGAPVLKEWVSKISDYIKSKPIIAGSQRHWLWIKLAWSLDASYLETFSPTFDQNQYFPWEEYFAEAEKHGKTQLIMIGLRQLRDDRVKSLWVDRLLEKNADPALLKVIDTLHTSYRRAAYRARWHEARSDYLKAIENLDQELDETPLLNDQPRILRKIISLYSALARSKQKEMFSRLVGWAERLKSLGGLDQNELEDLSLISERLGEWDKAWKWQLLLWWTSEDTEKRNSLSALMDMAFRSKNIEEAQRLLVDFLFSRAKPDRLSEEILRYLVDPESAFHLKHLRQEFINRASKIFPLHEQLLKKRAHYDYRALLLWESFYGDPIESPAAAPNMPKKINYSLWGLTEVLTNSDSVTTFAKYVHTLPVEQKRGLEHDFLEDAQRIITKLAKQFRLSARPRVILTEEIRSPIRFSFDPETIEVKPDFFDELDPDTWSAIGVGFFQMIEDRKRGLFEEKALIERFFQGTLLSGIEIARLIKLFVWFAMAEKMISPEKLKEKPEELVRSLPFLNSLLIFYLSEDFARKQAEAGVVLR